MVAVATAVSIAFLSGFVSRTAGLREIYDGSVESRVFVTGAFGDCKYVRRALRLWNDLIYVGSAYPLVVMTQNVTQAKECASGETRFDQLHWHELQHNYSKNWCYRGSRREWHQSANKLGLFSLTHYDRILFLDADVRVHRNIDSLFSHPLEPHTLVGQYNGCGNEPPYYQYEPVGSFPPTVQTGRRQPVPFCNGVMLFRPEDGLLEKMLDFIEVQYHEPNSCSSGEQMVIAEFFLSTGRRLDLFNTSVVVGANCDLVTKSSMVHCWSGSRRHEGGCDALEVEPTNDHYEKLFGRSTNKSYR